MSREKALLLNDIIGAAKLVEGFIRGKSFEQYSADALTRSAVERQLTIATEAVVQLLELHPQLEPLITKARHVVGFRNRIIHACAATADEMVWAIAKVDLPRLRADAERLLGGASVEP